MKKFEVGSVVRLNSGSPAMTVSKAYDSGVVECVWFGGGSTHLLEIHSDAIKESEADDLKKF